MSELFWKLWREAVARKCAEEILSVQPMPHEGPLWDSYLEFLAEYRAKGLL